MQHTEAPAGDVVMSVVDEVRRDLAGRRARGEIPSFPAGELDQQFSAVVEAVEAGLVEQAPLDPGGLRHAAQLPTWQPAGGGARRLVGLLIRPLVRVVGALVRRQVSEFALRATSLIEELANRQNRVLFFLSRAHLDRVRSLEYRVAELERELERLRGPSSDGG